MRVHHDADLAACRAPALLDERRRWQQRLTTVAGGHRDEWTIPVSGRTPQQRE